MKKEKKEKSESIIVALLVLIIIILLVLVGLLATGTVIFKNGKIEDVTNKGTNIVQNYNNYEDQYTGKDPWGNELTITILSNNENVLNWVISSEYYKKEIQSALSNKTTTFNIQGISKTEAETNEFNYSGTLTLNDDSVTVKYESGQITSVSTAGGGGAYHVEALEDNAKTVTLEKTK